MHTYQYSIYILKTIHDTTMLAVSQCLNTVGTSVCCIICSVERRTLVSEYGRKSEVRDL